MTIINELKKIIDEYNLLKHTFYQAWSRGELSKEVLKDYAIQYYQQVTSFPRFISSVHSNCDDIETRKNLVHNLIDEEVHGTDHPTLWMQFALGMGATVEEVKQAKPYAETEYMVNKYYELAKRDWRDGLCALYTYECQVPEVSASKIEGLKEHYNISDESTLEFFKAHQVYDVEHADTVAKLIEAKIVDQDQAVKATKEAAIALWKFLDGMCEKHQIACH